MLSLGNLRPTTGKRWGAASLLTQWELVSHRRDTMEKRWEAVSYTLNIMGLPTGGGPVDSKATVPVPIPLLFCLPVMPQRAVQCVTSITCWASSAVLCAGSHTHPVQAGVASLLRIPGRHHPGVDGRWRCPCSAVQEYSLWSVADRVPRSHGSKATVPVPHCPMMHWELASHRETMGRSIVPMPQWEPVSHRREAIETMGYNTIPMMQWELASHHRENDGKQYCS